MTAIVEARHLQKTYGKIKAVDDVSFEIKEGEIFGLLGPNGAGKTTTIRMLSGLTDPDKGEARVDGCDVVKDPVGAKQRLGVVPESSNLYGELTALENLVYMAQLYGVSKAQWKPRSEELLKRFGLFERKDDRFQGFSKGLKRRLTIAAALVHQPRIVFFGRAHHRPRYYERSGAAQNNPGVAAKQCIRLIDYPSDPGGRGSMRSNRRHRQR